MRLELSPGKVVLETGTGSGSLTHALAGAVAPDGEVHTFEYHNQRAAQVERQRQISVDAFDKIPAQWIDFFFGGGGGGGASLL